MSWSHFPICSCEHVINLPQKWVGISSACIQILLQSLYLMFVFQLQKQTKKLTNFVQLHISIVESKRPLRNTISQVFQINLLKFVSKTQNNQEFDGEQATIVIWMTSREWIPPFTWQIPSLNERPHRKYYILSWETLDLKYICRKSRRDSLITFACT